jgi:hypothetical protein
MTTLAQRKANVRLGLTLAVVAVVVFVAFICKMVWFGR